MASIRTIRLVVATPPVLILVMRIVELLSGASAGPFGPFLFSSLGLVMIVLASELIGLVLADLVVGTAYARPPGPVILMGIGGLVSGARFMLLTRSGGVLWEAMGWIGLTFMVAGALALGRSRSRERRGKSVQDP